jgi:hypothetical protein
MATPPPDPTAAFDLTILPKFLSQVHLKLMASSDPQTVTSLLCVSRRHNKVQERPFFWLKMYCASAVPLDMSRLIVVNPKKRVKLFLHLLKVYNGPPDFTYLLSHSKFRPKPHLDYKLMHSAVGQIAGDALATNDVELALLCLRNSIVAQRPLNKFSIRDHPDDGQAMLRKIMNATTGRLWTICSP